MFYKADGTFIKSIIMAGNGKKSLSFITPTDTLYLVIQFGQYHNEDETLATLSNIQLEYGDIATEYETYKIVESNDIITSNNNYNLTAIWEPVQ